MALPKPSVFMGLPEGRGFYHSWDQDRIGFSWLVVLEFLEAIIKKYGVICRHQSVSVQNVLWCFCVIL